MKYIAVSNLVLCLDSKNGGGKLMPPMQSMPPMLCLDSKNGGGKLNNKDTIKELGFALIPKTGAANSLSSRSADWVALP